MMKEMVGGCCVCADESGWQENPLVYCDGCDLAVHQGCYGIIQVPEGNWYCSKCVDLRKPVADAQCKLCPLPYGALKRTQDNGWAHVICALYIPEIKFGDVNSMDPVITSEVPLESFSRVCYICAENGRGEASKYGVCVRCHRDNCKKYFHVTCAQWSGLLCEEHGGQKCVRYIGFCNYHYKRYAQNDANIKLIPAYRPSNCNSLPYSQTIDSKVGVRKENGPYRPPSCGDNRPSSTLDTRPPSTASTHSLASSTNPVRPQSQGRPASVHDAGARTLPAAALPPHNNSVRQNGPSTVPQHAMYPDTPIVSTVTPLPPTTGASLLSTHVPRTSPSSMHKFTAISPPPPTQKPAVTGAVPAASPAPIMPGVQDSAVVKNEPSGSAPVHSNEFNLPPYQQFTTTTAPKPQGRPPGTGKRGRPPNHSLDPNRPTVKRPRKNQSKKTVKCLLEEVSQVVDDTVQSFQRERELSHQHQQQTSLTPSTSNQQSILNPIAQQPIEMASVSIPGLPLNLPPSSLATYETPLPAFASLADGIQASTSLGPVRPVPMLGTLTSDQASSAFPGTLEQLLERQWEQGSQFLMDQAKHFDVASMLSCLHSLKEENNRMDGDIGTLTTRRDHLLAVNARLGVTLGAQQILNTHSPTRLITSHSGSNIQLHQSTDSSPSSVVAPYRAASTISPASQGSNSKSLFAQSGSALVSPLAVSSSKDALPPVNPSYGAFTSVNINRQSNTLLQNAHAHKTQADLSSDRGNCASGGVSAGFLMPRAPEAMLSAAGAFNSQLSQLSSQLTQDQLVYLMTAQQAAYGLAASPHPNLLASSLQPPANTNNSNKHT